MSDTGYVFGTDGLIRRDYRVIILPGDMIELVRLANLGLTVEPVEPDYQRIAHNAFVEDQDIAGHMPGHSLKVAVDAVLAIRAVWEKDKEMRKNAAVRR